MKRTVLVLSILVAGLAAWFYLSPRLAARHLQDAARAGDVEALSELVDFPLVREQLKADLKASLLESTSKRDSANPFGTALAAGLGGLLVDGLVNQFVSPSGIAALVRYGSTDSTHRQREPQLSTHMRYRDASTFAVTVRDAERPLSDTVTLVFRRSGISWRLARLEMIPQVNPVGGASTEAGSAEAVAKLREEREKRREDEARAKAAAEAQRLRSIRAYVSSNLSLEDVRIAAGDQFGRTVDGVFGTI